MSIRVKNRLNRLGIITITREERQEIDRILKAKTGKHCDEAVECFSDEEFRGIVRKAKRLVRERKRKLALSA